MLFNFSFPVQIISGANCVKENYRRFAELGSRALIVTGKSSAKKSGALDDVLESLQMVGVSGAVFDEIQPNPMLSACCKGGETAKKIGADFIIGIGGGSAIDAARAVSCFAASNFADAEDIFKDQSKSLPLVSVSTTAGTGSEVDGAAVLTVDSVGEKRTINAPNLFAKYCFADYRYTYSNSYQGTVSTGLDAMCHALEDWFSTNATEPACVAGFRAMELVYPWLEKMADGYFEAENEQMRKELYYGSLWAGIAITMVGTGFPHIMGYPLTEKGHIPHGIACAVFEKDFLRVVWPYIEESQKQKLLSVIGSLDKFDVVINKLTVNDISVNENMIKKIAMRAADSNNGKRTPGGLTVDAAEGIARKLFYKAGQTTPLEGGWRLGK